MRSYTVLVFVLVFAFKKPIQILRIKTLTRAPSLRARSFRLGSIYSVQHTLMGQGSGSGMLFDQIHAKMARKIKIIRQQPIAIAYRVRIENPPGASMRRV